MPPPPHKPNHQPHHPRPPSPSPATATFSPSRPTHLPASTQYATTQSPPTAPSLPVTLAGPRDLAFIFGAVAASGADHKEGRTGSLSTNVGNSKPTEIVTLLDREDGDPVRGCISERVRVDGIDQPSGGGRCGLPRRSKHQSHRDADTSRGGATSATATTPIGGKGCGGYRASQRKYDFVGNFTDLDGAARHTGMSLTWVMTKYFDGLLTLAGEYAKTEPLKPQCAHCARSRGRRVQAGNGPETPEMRSITRNAAQMRHSAQIPYYRNSRSSGNFNLRMSNYERTEHYSALGIM
ncbi:hypothetical protein P167DRAFT_568890 [Morchella conica CCBAS932]|uniref:Uncharacterized protein n=1 Tax=Morchella conica CCBAS932 TaxID=1392247 RepID=A0A3N4K8U5_9PEZI|nr:hypothetical protein P167DRAFT_568890 [Morchella conica CCBAS932]